MFTLVKGLIFPGVLIGSLAALDALLTAGFDPGLSLFATSVANLIVIALMEVEFPLRREWAWWRDGQSINDLIHGALLTLAGPRIGEAALGSAIVAGAAAVASISQGGAWPNDWPFWAQMLLAILIADFADWAKHWGYHNLAPMWPIHALHHNAEKMHVFKAARLHVFEATIRFALISAPLLVLGAGHEVIIWYGALMNFLGNLNHSNVDMPIPGFVHYLFATPQVHRLHHEIDPDLGRSNLSPITLLPDLMFGTFRHPGKHALTRVGVADNPIPDNLLAQLASPLIWPFLAWRKRRLAPRANSQRKTS